MSRFTSKQYNQAGFEAVGVIVALLFVAVVGLVGYKVVNMNKSATVDQSSSSKVDTPTTIKTNADLTSAGKSLDQSGTQLDSNLNDTSLDSDLKPML